MLKSFDQISEKLEQNKQRKRVGVVVAQDEHTLDAVIMAVKAGLIEPVLIGRKNEITVLLERLNSAPDAFEIIDVAEPPECAKTATLLVRDGKLDCLIKGKLETADLLKAVVNREYGIRDSETLSHVAFYESPYYHKLFASTDGALLTYPSLEQKKSEIENAVKVFHKLGVPTPKVGVLAAVDFVNPKMKESVEAAELKAMWEDGKITGCIVEGPITYDIALQKEAAKIKDFSSPVAGDADLLVVPDITSGNLLLKALSVTGGAKFAGGIIGAKVPIVLTSRSMSVRDKYLSIILNAVIGKI